VLCRLGDWLLNAQQLVGLVFASSREKSSRLLIITVTVAIWKNGAFVKKAPVLSTVKYLNGPIGRNAPDLALVERKLEQEPFFRLLTKAVTHALF
jgi:hypothetical protein